MKPRAYASTVKLEELIKSDRTRTKIAGHEKVKSALLLGTAHQALNSLPFTPTLYVSGTKAIDTVVQEPPCLMETTNTAAAPGSTSRDGLELDRKPRASLKVDLADQALAARSEFEIMTTPADDRTEPKAIACSSPEEDHVGEPVKRRGMDDESAARSDALTSDDTSTAALREEMAEKITPLPVEREIAAKEGPGVPARKDSNAGSPEGTAVVADVDECMRLVFIGLYGLVVRYYYSLTTQITKPRQRGLFTGSVVRWAEAARN